MAITSYGKDDVIGCLLDLDATPHTISWTKNGTHLGVGFILPAEAKGPFFPAVAVKNAQMEFTFGGAGGGAGASEVSVGKHGNAWDSTDLPGRIWMITR